MAALTGGTTGSITSFWINFFLDAGIPAGEATNYAITFTDNRISTDMLMDLNKEYLNDMGITVLGDVIAILKKSKAVHAEETAKKRAKRAESFVTPSPPRRSTPASRTVNHYLGSDPDAKPMNEPVKKGPKMSKELAARLGPTAETLNPGRVCFSNKDEEANTPPKVRRVLPEHEGRYKIIMPQGTTERSRNALLQQNLVPRPKSKSKSSVFGRLGAETPTSSSTGTVTGVGIAKNKNIPAQDSSSVFSRLGTTVKRAATSTSGDQDDHETTGTPLAYAGVLKDNAETKERKRKLVLEEKKKALILRKRNSDAAKKKAALEQRLGPQRPEISTTAGILSLNAKQDQVNVRKRLGKTVLSSATSTTTNPSSKVMQGVHARLGKQVMEVSTSSMISSTPETLGIFSRLGLDNKEHE